MKKIIKWLMTICVIFLIGWGIYYFFFDCEHIRVFFDRDFVLEKLDYATVEGEVIVKLLDIDDNRCKEENCERTGEFVVKVLVVNNHRISYVELGTLAESRKELEKLGYILEVNEVTEDGKVTLKLNKSE